MNSIAHAQSRATSTRPEKVYFAAPIPTYNTKRYIRALKKLERQFPKARVLHAAALFAGREDWLATYRDKLADVTHCRILTDVAGYVGRGVYDEWEYVKERGATVDALLPGNHLVQNPRLLIVHPKEWWHYAVVLPPKLPFETSSAFALIAEAALADPEHWQPVQVDELTGQLQPIPRIDLYAAVVQALEQQGGAHG